MDPVESCCSRHISIKGFVMRITKTALSALGLWCAVSFHGSRTPTAAQGAETVSQKESEQLPASAARVKVQGAAIVEFYGYKDCIQLENGKMRVTLCPRAGGRVLEYALNGVNALYLPPGDEGWEQGTGRGEGAMNAGRFDIGPEQTIPQHPNLWMGRWTGEITGNRAARLVSQPDDATGVQLIREFALDEKSSRLDCKQTIKNISQSTREYCHWSRTFALGGGICVVPLTQPSRLPTGYVMYEPESLINFRPVDPKIVKKDGFLVILGAQKQPKLGMDTAAGWFAYLMKNDLMFVKRFPVERDRPYNEVAGLTMSIWYPDGPMCELEPIGPREKLVPDQSASFTETWYLLPQAFPRSESVSPKDIATAVERNAR